jgi:hypothetical protein
MTLCELARSLRSFEKRYGDDALIKLTEMTAPEQFDALCDEMYEKSGVVAPIRELVVQMALATVPRRAKALLETTAARMAHMLCLFRDAHATLRVSASDAVKLRQQASELEAQIEQQRPAMARIEASTAERVANVLGTRAAELSVVKGKPPGKPNALCAYACAPAELVYTSQADAQAAVDACALDVESSMSALVQNEYMWYAAPEVSEQTATGRAEIKELLHGHMANFPELNVSDLVFDAAPVAVDVATRRAVLKCAVALRPTLRTVINYETWWFFWTKKVERVMRGPTEFVLDGADTLEKIYQFGCSSMRRLIRDVDAKARKHAAVEVARYCDAVIAAIEAKCISLEQQSKSTTEETEAKMRDVAASIEGISLFGMHVADDFKARTPTDRVLAADYRRMIGSALAPLFASVSIVRLAPASTSSTSTSSSSSVTAASLCCVCLDRTKCAVLEPVRVENFDVDRACSVTFFLFGAVYACTFL